MPTPDAPDTAQGAPADPEPTPLAHPSDGVPAVSVSTDEIADAAAKLSTGHGPFAVDAERVDQGRNGHPVERDILSTQ